jgi:hypothetical protein
MTLFRPGQSPPHVTTQGLTWFEGWNASVARGPARRNSRDTVVSSELAMMSTRIVSVSATNERPLLNRDEFMPSGEGNRPTLHHSLR